MGKETSFTTNRERLHRRILSAVLFVFIRKFVVQICNAWTGERDGLVHFPN